MSDVLHDGEVDNIDDHLARINKYADRTRVEQLRPDARTLANGNSVAYWLLYIDRLDPGRVKQIQSQYIVEENEEGALINCPCGGHPIVERRLAQCSAGCERWYAAVGGRVFVTYGDMKVPGRS